jgi:hypothetical protein
MKRRELEEMIKAAYLSEADFTNAQDDDAALGGMYDDLYEEDLDEMIANLDEANEEESTEEILARITGTSVDPYMAEAQVDMPKINLPAINTKIEDSPKIDVIAAKIQNDPKAMDALNKLASMYGLNKMNELDSSDFKSIEMAARKFASNLQEMEGSDDASLTLSGILGGPLLLMLGPGVYEFILQLVQSMQANPDYVVGTDSLIFIGSAVAGMVVGNILDRIKNKSGAFNEAKEEESLDDILTRITGTAVDPYLAEAKGDEEETDIEVDAEEETTDGGEEKNDSIVVDKKIVSLSSLPQETRKILDSLETLRAQAEEFGDQKFITQVGNTITFFTRDFVVAGDEPTRAKVDESLKNKKIMKESLEILRMKKLAGLLTEGEYAKALLKEEEASIADFLNANIEEFKRKVANPRSKFEIIGDKKVATAGPDSESGIDVSFDKAHMLELFPASDPFNKVKETEIAGRKVYYNNYL